MQAGHNIIATNNSKKININNLLLVIVLLDLLLFPYIRALHCGIGMILVAMWCFFHISKISLSTWLFVLLVFFSNVMGAAFFELGTKGLVSAIMIIYIFFLYDYLSQAFVQNLHIVKRIMLIYIFFNLILALIYIKAPQQYFSTRSLWTMSGSEINFTELQISRFTSIYSDPNNAGCSLTILLSYLLIYEKLSKAQLVCALSITLVCVVLTFSVSATVLFSFVLVIVLAFAYKTEDQKETRNIMIAFFIIAVLFLIVYLSVSSNSLSDNLFVKTLQNRIKKNTEDNNLGGRVTIWINLLTSVNPFSFILFGHGMVLDNANKIYAPHNGLLYLLYAYGLPSVIVFLNKFTSFIKDKFIYSLPIFITFTTIFINTGFSDYRFITISTLVVVLCKVKYRSITSTQTSVTHPI